jgi:hypothetical protein
MPREPISTPIREIVSLSELAEDVLGLSRARVYELIERGALPRPIYDVRTRRPMFNAHLQRAAIAVRSTGVGVDGSAVIFYRRNRREPTQEPMGRPSRTSRSSSRPRTSRYESLIGSLQALGVSQANQQSVEAAISECFPNGLDGQDESEVIRILFRFLRAKERA